MRKNVKMGEEELRGKNVVGDEEKWREVKWLTYVLVFLGVCIMSRRKADGPYDSMVCCHKVGL